MRGISEVYAVLTVTQVNKTLRDLIDNNMAIQYQLELALAGMVDGPSRNATTRERLDALRAFKTAYSTGTQPTEEVIVPASQRADMFFVPSNPAEIAYIDKEDGELVLKIYRPSSTLHGITNEPRETVISGMGQLLAAHPGMSADNLFVDSEQELLVYAFSTRVFDDEGYPEVS